MAPILPNGTFYIDWSDRRISKRVQRECVECGAPFETRDSSSQKLCDQCKHLQPRRARLAINHGMTLAEFDRMHEAQDGKCAICQQKPAEGKKLCVDHDHETGKIRGLLCSNCNSGLGMFADRPEVLKAAIAYIEKSLLMSREA